MAGKSPVRIRGGITTSNLLFVPSPRHGLISLVPWDSTASVADLETAAVNSPRILSQECSDSSPCIRGCDPGFAPASSSAVKTWPDCSATSRRAGQVTGQGLLELREVGRDHTDVEATKDRLLGLAVEQKPERRIHELFRRMPACREAR